MFGPHDLARRPARPTARELARELTAVVADLPRFATAPLRRRRHLRWGATVAELATVMPGDELLGQVAYECTRAITIDAPPEDVWPWLVQVGCLKAGFYADDLLDNLGHPSARSILPEHQHLEPGQWVPMSHTPTDATAFRVAGFDPGAWLLWQQPLSTWSWTLTELPGRRTRLVTRLRARRDWRHPGPALLSLLLLEVGDFPMMRRMLLGIRERAEARAAP